MKPWLLLGALGCLAASLLPAGCRRAPANRVQGYVEGEFVYVASPLAGALDTLSVARGTQVKEGAPLFALETDPEKAAHDEAMRRLAQGRANLEDARKGKRPTELDAIEAQIRQAQAALELSESDLARQTRLIRTGATSRQELDRARSTRDQDRQRIVQLQADLETARLGSREAQIVAAEANVRALEAALAKAEWDLSQKHQNAPQAGLVFDTLYREGEWVAAGKPVVALLPPANIKVRAFIPEEKIGTIRLGETVRVWVDGNSVPFTGRVSFISPQAEYTPPVIYSRESRSKLVFMIEAVFEPKAAVQLHPGQPVSVEY